ncbi:MAG: cytochrome P450 [Actinobacteria bacterium]|nr:cytochrome P450 [Actinomycetota bacterium]
MFNPFAPGFAENPYEEYRVERESEPIQQTPFGPWIVFSHAESVQLLRDVTLSVDVRKAMEILGEDPRDRAKMRAELFPDKAPREDTSILNIDPPDHTRLRKLVSSVFTPRRVADLAPMIERIVDEHLDAVADRGEMDLIADLAFPLPFAVISEMLGMPDGDSAQLREWSHTLVKILDFTIGPEELMAAVIAGENLREHIANVIEWKRSNLGDDLLSALILAEDNGDVLSDVELVDQVNVLFIAGHETTVNLIGNGTWALLQNRDQLELLRDDPTVESTAIDELLRYDSPVQISRRITLEPIQVGGHDVAAGTFVLTSLGSANRDPAVFGPTADQLDLRRADAARHLAFGSGTHHCLGASLARMEGTIAITRLIRRFPELQAMSAPAWNGRLVLRGMDSLQLSLR